jgi:GAF domain-containing protein
VGHEDADHPVASPNGDVGELLAHAAVRRDDIGLILLDTELRVRRSRIMSKRFRGLVVRDGLRFDELSPPEDAASLTERLREVLASGEPLISFAQRVTLGEGVRPLILSLSVLRVEDADGRPSGLVITFVDATEPIRAQQRLELLLNAGSMIGSSLDVITTTRQLAKSLVPAFGDMATVNLAVEVFTGGRPPPRTAGNLGLRRAALAPEDAAWPDGFMRPGDDFPNMPDHPVTRRYQRGDLFVLSDREAIVTSLGNDPERIRRIVPDDDPRLALIVLPLLAQGVILGSIEVWRTSGAEPFASEDMRVLREVAARAAISIDNARRYTREHTTVLALQRSLLPVGSTETPAVRAAGLYLPTTVSGRGIGGDWYDVIPLSSLRVALVVGDVVGHGLRSIATMSRVRAAVQTLADLDLTPDELLTHLDDLILRLTEGTEPAHEDAAGSTCLYVVYDPINRTCAMASAGHPPPALVRSDGTATFVDLVPGPPLGFGGLPFEATEFDMAPGEFLALYTNGLIEQGGRPVGEGMTRLLSRLSALGSAGPRGDGDADLQPTVARVAREILPETLTDDVAFLLARVRATPAEDIATWRIPSDPAAVATARDLATEQLTAWGLRDLAFNTGVVVSELITNAIRYTGDEPADLRLVRTDKALICEVSDSSNTQPWLRRARSTDEGGRGLFIIAQLTNRWGSRYTSTGKTIWTEQLLPDKRA